MKRVLKGVPDWMTGTIENYGAHRYCDGMLRVLEILKEGGAPFHLLERIRKEADDLRDSI